MLFLRTVLFTILSLLHSVEAYSYQKDTTSRKIALTVDHPAFMDGPREVSLVQVDEEQAASYFYMTVESVLCADHICKVVPVRLYWDSFGNYIKYRLEEGVTLEKGDGQPFDEDDYIKLDEILTNKNAALRSLAYSDIIQTKVHGEVDAMSGATALILPDDESIEGATWTCYTLWHWVHGEMHHKVREIYAATLDQQQLVAMLGLNDKEKVKFAYESLARLNELDNGTKAILLESAQSWDKEIAAIICPAMQNWHVSFQTGLAQELLSNPSSSARLLTLDAISENKELSSFRSLLLGHIGSTDSFLEVDKTIEMMGRYGELYEGEVDALQEVMLRENFLIARRLFYFLKDQSMTRGQQEIMKEFAHENTERL
ncbi:hypothetical protein DN752_23535 [Echinicola strongylocentroti]|uniref:HEAT repeat domain-containing protein n=1 Tax=Echinicola strongylocentroti TaxID=1795355 RepID=A0A2Z4IP24_9BACT|nr:hypothetical protein [Echinicola strongylocentroti]AWW32871.1 hypothetical protein DN752_23535 [Echinicola strongylocentroti]